MTQQETGQPFEHALAEATARILASQAIDAARAGLLEETLGVLNEHLEQDAAPIAVVPVQPSHEPRETGSQLSSMDWVRHGEIRRRMSRSHIPSNKFAFDALLRVEAAKRAKHTKGAVLDTKL